MQNAKTETKFLLFVHDKIQRLKGQTVVNRQQCNSSTELSSTIYQIS